MVGRRPHRSDSQPPTTCDVNEPIPYTDTAPVACSTLKPRCAVKYTVKNGSTKIPTRLINVPSHKNQNVRGSPPTVV